MHVIPNDQSYLPGAVNQGEQAYRTGLTRQDNPFKCKNHKLAYNSWVYGYELAKKRYTHLNMLSEYRKSLDTTSRRYYAARKQKRSG